MPEHYHFLQHLSSQDIKAWVWQALPAKFCLENHRLNELHNLCPNLLMDYRAKRDGKTFGFQNKISGSYDGKSTISTLHILGYCWERKKYSRIAFHYIGLE